MAAPCRYQRCWAAHHRRFETRNLPRRTTLLTQRRLVRAQPLRLLCTPRLECTRPPQTILPSDDRKRPITRDHTILEPRHKATTRPPKSNDMGHRRHTIRAITQVRPTLAGCLPARLPGRAVNPKRTQECLLGPWRWFEVPVPTKVMYDGMRWAVPRPAPQWITTLREQVYDPTPTTTGTGQSANEERQSNGNEKGGI